MSSLLSFLTFNHFKNVRVGLESTFLIRCAFKIIM